MKSLIFTIAFSLIAGAAVAQEKKGDVSSFYEKNTVLNYNEGNNPAGEIEQPTKFDPNFHQAVMRVENPELEDETIAMELQKGYMVKGKVIRPSMVQVVANS